ncbi:MAG: hypothetical protein ACKO28_11180 [Cyanobium sp.]
MSQSLPPWSLHWSSNGELSPMDRAALAHLFLALHRPELVSTKKGAPAKIYNIPTVKP